jgi:hypothetical protein
MGEDSDTKLNDMDCGSFSGGGHVQRPDRGQAQLMLLTPAAELRHRLHVRRAGILVAPSPWKKSLLNLEDFASWSTPILLG